MFTEIRDVSWGSAVVTAHHTSSNGESRTYLFRDAMIAPRMLPCEWDWESSNTHHIPGVQTVDVQRLLDNGARTIVLALGFESALQVDPKTRDFLCDKNIVNYALPTPDAIVKYKQLCSEGHDPGMLLHTTC